MSCYNCRDNHAPYAEGVYVYEDCECISPCQVCNKEAYRAQQVKHWNCWKGGWNPINGPIPHQIMDYDPNYTPKLSIPTGIDPPSISKIGYKFIDGDLRSHHGRKDRKPWTLGKARYVSKDKPLKLCSHGFHSSDTPEQAYSYVSTGVIIKVERLGEIIEDSDKSKVVSRGLKPLAIAYIRDWSNARLQGWITNNQFNEFIIRLLNQNQKGYYNDLVREVVSETKVKDALAHHLKLV